jgi:hypothetical protein
MTAARTMRATAQIARLWRGLCRCLLIDAGTYQDEVKAGKSIWVFAYRRM